MPRTMTFSNNFGHQTGPLESVFYFAGETYDVPDDIAALVDAAKAGVDAVTAPAAQPAAEPVSGS